MNASPRRAESRRMHEGMSLVRAHLRFGRLPIHAQLFANPLTFQHSDGRLRSEEHQIHQDTRGCDQQ